ncbi:hypothetical protein AXF42_Ash012370 [Apostasia shenzhenica]|uniref:C2 domain-containing protein n=1 Tax=Apostasia shenzhenica TaxID=1088818 RepID=A0A2I0AD00_9ASPA|nr:hypothetical protein AXF42_Ash012370 [Apostasia shenzhenica]
MACRTLELTLISAEDLKDVNVLTKMDVYALATITGDRRQRQRTPTDRNCGKNPCWNAVLRFIVPGDPAAAVHISIHVLLRSERVLGDLDVGEVHIPLKDLLGGRSDGSSFVSYQVRKPSGRAKGVLNLSYKFVDPPAAVTAPPEFTAYPPPAGKGAYEEEPVMAYPAAGSSASAYPPAGYWYGAPPPAGYGYGYGAPAAGYGYGAPGSGYGYGAPAAGYGYGGAPAKNNRNNFGMGLGAGLLGGAIGGLLIGDLVSDAAGYDGGYDAGFDAGGFGF